ncbi:MAG: hypothetical protein QOH10_1150 [Actinomycetota bacterium]|nr:hypothetical protein [Actinomycetota bacterium]
MLVIGVLVAIVVSRSPTKTATPTSTQTTSFDVAHPKEKDVRLTACRYENFSAIAALTIKNPAAEDLNYVVEVSFRDGLIDFTDGIASTDHLPAGHVARLVASGISTDSPPKHLNCTIVRIERFR